MGHKFAATFAFLAIVSVIAVTLPQSVYDAGCISREFNLREVLSESYGWFIVVSLGMVFAVVISAEIKIEERYLGVVETSEWLNTAGRIIKTGLTAAAIVSAWTWVATLLNHQQWRFNTESAGNSGMQQAPQFKYCCLGF